MLKIKPEHYKTLESACTKVLDLHPDSRAKYAEQGYTPKRFRWDVLYATQIGNETGIRWVNSVLYPYLDDTHIDSALKRIVG